MNLTAQIRLHATAEQMTALEETMRRANSACNAISRFAWQEKCFKQYDLHKHLYKTIKEQFALSAQVVVRCIAKVADSYKLDKKTERVFSAYGAIAYDARILSWNFYDNTVSIWTVQGRMKIGFSAGEHQANLLEYQRGESDLILRKHSQSVSETGFVAYLYPTCKIEPLAPIVPTSALGVDLGIVNIATDSDGEIFSGADIETKREWYAKRRAVLQRVGTKSAKRRLKQLSGKQRRFQKDSNHRIAKTIVRKAKDTTRAIALEDLTGIRTRATVRKPQLRKSQRARHSNWAFGHLRACITYKAERVGVWVVLLDPRNSSRTCSQCGYCDKANRRTQAEFVCQSCQHSMSADNNAAIILKQWAVVKLPMVSNGGISHYSRLGTSHPASAGGI
jgi:putative transposase